MHLHSGLGCASGRHAADDVAKRCIAVPVLAGKALCAQKQSCCTSGEQCRGQCPRCDQHRHVDGDAPVRVPIPQRDPRLWGLRGARYSDLDSEVAHEPRELCAQHERREQRAEGRPRANPLRQHLVHVDAVRPERVHGARRHPEAPVTKEHTMQVL